MPRNAQGIYSLPVGNPVVTDTSIDSVWANTTMGDLANEITNSLPRDGSASMTGSLTLSGDAVAGLHATTKQQLDAAISNVESGGSGALDAHTALEGDECHGLGTAATKDVMADDYEYSNDTVMPRGAFGLGSRYTQTYGYSGDEDILDRIGTSILPTQFFSVGYDDAEMIGGPPSATGYGNGMVIAGVSSSVQLYWCSGEGSDNYNQRMFFRTEGGLNGWEPWKEVDTV